MGRPGILISPLLPGGGGSVFLNARKDIGVIGTNISTGNGGDITLISKGAIVLEGGDERVQSSGLFTSVSAQGEAGDINIAAKKLSVLNGALIASETFGFGQSGNVAINVEETALFEGVNSNNRSPSGISTVLPVNGQGRGGSIEIIANNLRILDGAQLVASTQGQGDGGDISLDIANDTQIDGISPISGSRSSLRSRITRNGEGNAGNIQLTTRNLEVLNGASIDTSNIGGRGSTGNIVIDTHETARFENGSDLISITFDGIATQENGDIRITASNLEIIDGSEIATTYLSDDIEGNSGNIFLNVRDIIRIEGQGQLPFSPAPSRILTLVGPDASGQGGNIDITAARLDVFEGDISARNDGRGNAGNISINLQDSLYSQNGQISTNSERNSGGKVGIAANNIFLLGNSDIETFVNFGTDNGGDIIITANTLIAFDDSDILAFAADGSGGDVDLSRTAFFGENFQFALQDTNPNTLDNNERVDINATGGAASGIISLANINFIENSMTELPDNLVNSEALVANSCIARSHDTASSFSLTGSDSLAQQPNSAQPIYSLHTPQSIHATQQSNNSVTEPQEVYQLADGRLVMSRHCSD